MDDRRFFRSARVLTDFPTRRQILHGLAAFGLASVGPRLTQVVAAKKKKKKKFALCLDGRTVRASGEKKKKLLKKGAASGSCPTSLGCTPQCPGNTCGGDDGCGGICGCAAGSICLEGVCRACTVTCGSDPATCGDALQAALDAGGTVVACPGRYARNFILPTGVTLIGAGDGAEPGSNTIIDARGNGRAVRVLTGVTAALNGLRITGGNESLHGGGVLNDGAVTLTGCTVAGNHTVSPGSAGGGIGNFGRLTLNTCTVSGNTSPTAGGGIYNAATCTLTVNGSAITRNSSQMGGGLFNSGTANFDSASRVTGNTATGANGGGGINSSDTGSTVALNGADVSGNTPTNCVAVPECVG